MVRSLRVLAPAAWLAMLALIPIAAATAQHKPETISIPREHRGKPIQVTAELFLPTSAAKVPVMVIHHGSGGVSAQREHRYAREMVDMGVGALVIDSFKPRGIANTVADQSAVSTTEMVDDALTALKALASHPRVDAGKVGIVGFSKGGSVALQAAHERTAARALPSGLRYALHVPVYPWCGNHYHRPRTTGAPILFLIGGADTYAGVAPCTEYADKLEAAGAKVEVRIYDKAQHGFDGGPAYSVAKGENFSRCVFEEQADGSWKERVSGQITNDKQGRRIEAGYAGAIAACRTLGVSGGPNAAAASAAMAELKTAVRRHLLGRPD